MNYVECIYRKCNVYVWSFMHCLVKLLYLAVECLKSKVQQEEAITDDLRTSLESEKQRSQNLVPALQRERERTLELSSEMAALSQETSNANKNAHEQIDKLRYLQHSDEHMILMLITSVRSALCITISSFLGHSWMQPMES